MAETAVAYDVPKGAAYFTTQQVVFYIAAFLFYVLLARILTRAEIGQVSLLAATLAVFNTLTQLALPTTATRYISGRLAMRERETAGAVARTTLRLLLATAITGTVLSLAILSFIGPFILGTPDATLLLVTTFLAGLALDFVILYGGYFLGAGLYAQTVYQSILYTPLSRGLGLVLAFSGLRVFGIVLGWAIGAIVTLLVSFYFWRGRLPGKTNYPVGPLLAFTLPLFASTLITLGTQWGDIAVLQALLGELSTTGAYYIVVSSVGFLSVFWIPVSSALYPALSADHSANNTQGINDRLSVSLRLTNLAVLPLGAALAAVAETALEVAYGPSYRAETLPFAILTLATVLTAQAAILTATLQAVGKTRALLLVAFASTIVDLATVGVAARTLGPTAGALGRGLLYLAMVLMSYKTLQPEVHVSPTRGFRKAMILALGVSIPLFVTDQGLAIILNLTALLRLPILLLIFAICFVAVSRSLHVFHPGDFAILKTALPRRLQPYLRTVEHLIIG